MSAPGKLVTTIVVLMGFVMLLLYSTLSSQKAECRVLVEYNGRRDSATASAASPEEAERQARTTACGTLAQGMDERIACDNTPPVTRHCRSL